jgi:hypothetical protein
MRWKVLVVLGSAIVLLAAQIVVAQGNPRGTSKVSLNGKEVSVEYGRPSLKGRAVGEMLDRLKPGAMWRLGADTSTTFSTAADLMFGDATVPKGDYSLWARKEAAGGWKLVFNKQHGQWGTQHDAAQDLVAVPLNQTKAAKSAEMVTIELAQGAAGGVLTIQWGDMSLAANFKAK